MEGGGGEEKWLFLKTFSKKNRKKNGENFHILFSPMGPRGGSFRPFSAVLGVNLTYETGPTPTGPSYGDPKTVFQGSLHAKKCLEAF